MQDSAEKTAKRRGRPPMARPERKLANITFRSRGGMRERLQASAEARGLSVSEEVERRLDLSLDMSPDPFKTIALRMIVEKWKMIDALVAEGCKIEDMSIYARKAAEAVNDAINAADDEGWARGQSGERVKDFYGRLVERGIMQQLAGKHGGSLEAASASAADAAEQHEIFSSAAEGLPLAKAEAEAFARARRAKEA